MRGDFLARQWRIIKAIASANQGFTASQLAESEGVELRTVYRDLESLQSAGFPLYGKKEGRSTKWFLVDPVKGKGLPAPYTVGEIIALWLAKNMLAKLPDASLYQALDSLFEKFASSLVPSSLQKISEIQKSFKVVTPDEEDVRALEQKIDLVNQMVLAKKRMQVKMQDAKSGAVEEVLIDPYRTWRFEDNWYLMAFSHSAHKTQLLPIARLLEMRLLPEDCTADINFELSDFLRDVCNQVMEDKFRVRIRISPLWQQWFSGDHKNKTSPIIGNLQSDGSLEIEMHFNESISSFDKDKDNQEQP